MYNKTHVILNAIFSNVSLLLAILMCVSIWILTSFFPNFYTEYPSLFYIIYSAFIPILIGEIVIVKNKLSKLSSAVSTPNLITAFEKGEDLDDYLKQRFKYAKDVKMMVASAIGNSTDPHASKKKYVSFLENYIATNNRFTRLLVNNSNPKYYEDVKTEITKFKDNNYMAYHYKGACILDGRFSFFCIIDDSEICIGGGYNTAVNPNSICIKNEDVVNFYLSYFNMLKENSTSFRNLDGSIKVDYLEQLINNKSKESVKSMCRENCHC